MSKLRSTVQGMVDFKHMDRPSREFFLQLTETVKHYRSGHQMPNANLNGCSFAMGAGKDNGTIRFGFLAIGENIITTDIVVRDLVANPEEYIDNMLEAIGQGIEQMADHVQILVPGSRSILSAPKKADLLGASVSAAVGRLH
jgi:hypothetical protein